MVPAVPSVRVMLMPLLVFATLSLDKHAIGSDPPKTDRPNILFLFTDDQRADTIHALGNATIHTPNLDRLAETGFIFRNAYCMGSNQAAVCLPSRTMLLSGRSLFHLPALTPNAPNLPKTLAAAGYWTYHHGKRGNTPQQIQESFQVNRYLDDDETERRSGHPGREIANAAIQFLRATPNERPFFMYLAFANPHDPRVVVKEHRDRYDERALRLPSNFLPIHPFDNGELSVRDEALAPWPRTPELIRRHLADYYGVISYLDMQIGRILQALRETGQYDNTIIVFSSDHGLAIGSHGLMGKQNVYEDGMKVPLIIAGPGIPRGHSEAFVYLFDLYPTLCELTGSPAPRELDGESLAPVVLGRREGSRDTVLLAYRDVQRAVRRGDWKLIRYPRINRSQFFNVRSDPSETNDLSKDPQFSVRRDELMSVLAETQKQFGDTQPLSTDPPQSDAVDISRLRTPDS
jgi:arylsulfatase A-like enzyme